MILVTGATGNIGRALLADLRTHGAVRGLTRDVARAGFPHGVEAVEGDLTSAAWLGPALAGVRSLFLFLFLLQGLGPDGELLSAARQAGSSTR